MCVHLTEHVDRMLFFSPFPSFMPDHVLTPSVLPPPCSSSSSTHPFSNWKIDYSYHNKGRLNWFYQLRCELEESGSTGLVWIDLLKTCVCCFCVHEKLNISDVHLLCKCKLSDEGVSLYFYIFMWHDRMQRVVVILVFSPTAPIPSTSFLLSCD